MIVFLDEPVYCLSEELFFADCFCVCLRRKNDRINTFLIMNFLTENDCCFIACCDKFIKSQDYIYIDWSSRITQCFNYDGDYEFVCCADGVSSSFSINNFCFICQRIVLQEISNKLHILEISLFRK